MFTTTGLILILNATVVMANLTVMMVSQSHLIKTMNAAKR